MGVCILLLIFLGNQKTLHFFSTSSAPSHVLVCQCGSLSMLLTLNKLVLPEPISNEQQNSQTYWGKNFFAI